MNEPAFLGTAHFAVGCVAIIVGFAAFAARKGARIHRSAGAIFVVTMLLLTMSGLWLSFARDILFTVFLSTIAFHAVFTGWATAAKKSRVGMMANKASPLVSAAITIGAVFGGAKAAAAPGGMMNGLPPAAFYVIAMTAFLIFVFDLTFNLAGAPSEQRRITRHVWRMGFSFFLATGIFFFGNNHVLPEILRTPVFLSAPVIAVIVWTVYYAVRTRFSR